MVEKGVAMPDERLYDTQAIQRGQALMWALPGRLLPYGIDGTIAAMNDPAPFQFDTLESRSGEYYQVYLQSDTDQATGKTRYFVHETHGYVKDGSNGMHPVTTYSPVDGYETREEALQRYEQQLAKRASEGFVQSLSMSFDPFEGLKYKRHEVL